MVPASAVKKILPRRPKKTPITQVNQIHENHRLKAGGEAIYS